MQRALWLTVIGAMTFLAGTIEARPQEEIDTGRLVGTVSDGVAIFKGIPFAAPPVGDLRWQPPAAPASWRGTRNAADFGPICPQPRRPDGRRAAGFGQKQSEDCLYLNVWAPARTKKAPVMVWIHGGAFRFGSGASPIYDGTAFAKDGIVLVTINYRLGVLGFFAHPALTHAATSDEPLGNYGSMDQIAALRWVQRNIAEFGGDPNNVTVFGESAGGSSILYLFAAPSAQGLFAKVIIESGGGWNRSKSLSMMERRGAAFATRLGLPGADATLVQLRAVPANKTFDIPSTMGGIGPFEDGRLITEIPAKVFASDAAFDVPIIIGSNSLEASLMQAFRIKPAAMLARLTPEQRKIYAADDTSEEALAQAIFTDAVMGAPAHWIAKIASGGAPSWLYHFSYVTSFRRDRVPGAAHGSEITYAFATGSALAERIPLFSLSTEDEAMERLIHSCWVGFAKTGKPACDGVAWPAFDPRRDELMEFGSDPGVRAKFREARYKSLEATLLPLPGTAAGS